MAQNPMLPPPMECDPDLVTPEVLRANRQKIVAYVNGLVIESYQRQAQFGMWDRAQANIELAMYSRRLSRSSGKVRAPKVQNACISNAAIQTSKQWIPTLRQRATTDGVSRRCPQRTFQWRH